MNNPSMAVKGKPGARSVRGRVSRSHAATPLKCPKDMVLIKHPVWNVWFCGTKAERSISARRAKAHARARAYLSAHGIRPGT